jgi:hypothetical protein
VTFQNIFIYLKIFTGQILPVLLVALDFSIIAATMNSLATFSYCSAAREMTIKGDDNNLMNLIFNNITTENTLRNIRPHQKSFLPKMEAGKKAMTRTEDSTGGITLTIYCPNSNQYYDIYFVLCNYFDVDSAPHQDFGTIQRFKVRAERFALCHGSSVNGILDPSSKTSMSSESESRFS